MADVIEIDWTTEPPTVTERPFTAEEKAQREADAAAYKQAHNDAKTKAAIRKAAMTHAKSLGFTDEMISIMYPNLVEE